VSVLLLAGCTLRGPRPAIVRGSADDLLAGLTARRAAVTSLRARARLQSGAGRLWTRQALAVRRPGSLRVDVLSPFGLTLAVGTDGSTVWAYPPADAVRYEGPATPGNVSRLVGTPVTVGDLVDILLGLPPARTAAGAPRLDAWGDDEWRVVIPLADGLQSLWFTAASGLLVRAEEAHAGTVTLRLVFADYRDGFPYRVEVSSPSTGRRAALAYDAVERNAPLDPTLFMPPPAPRILPLETAAAPG
jgi:outer membrane lipoprotein-sorting protein